MRAICILMTSSVGQTGFAHCGVKPSERAAMIPTPSCEYPGGLSPWTGPGGQDRWTCRVVGVTSEISLKACGFCFAGILCPWPPLFTAPTKRASLLERSKWRGTGSIQTTANKELRLSPTAHKELNAANKHRVNFAVGPSTLEPERTVDLADTVISVLRETLGQGHMGKPCLGS